MTYPTNAVEFILDALKKECPLTVNQIAKCVPYSYRTMASALRKLREEGKVGRTKKLNGDLRLNYYYLIFDKGNSKQTKGDMI